MVVGGSRPISRWVGIDMVTLGTVSSVCSSSLSLREPQRSSSVPTSVDSPCALRAALTKSRGARSCNGEEKHACSHTHTHTTKLIK